VINDLVARDVGHVTPQQSIARGRVVSLTELAAVVASAHERGLSVALCHGCFDILHPGHIRHLEAARDLADILVATVTADRYVNKGPDRPVFSEAERAETLAGLRSVDAVAINPSESAVPVIRTVKPDLFVKGSEYETRPAEVNPLFFDEQRAIEDVGGRTAFTYEAVWSSTAAFRRLVSP
jgi:rfaE bifunctional protein nucleotidyltransferase chain/domain